MQMMFVQSSPFSFNFIEILPEPWKDNKKGHKMTELSGKDGYKYRWFEIPSKNKGIKWT